MNEQIENLNSEIETTKKWNWGAEYNNWKMYLLIGSLADWRKIIRMELGI